MAALTMAALWVCVALCVLHCVCVCVLQMRQAIDDGAWSVCAEIRDDWPPDDPPILNHGCALTLTQTQTQTRTQTQTLALHPHPTPTLTPLILNHMAVLAHGSHTVHALSTPWRALFSL
jgi:hypothetical protein